MNPKINIYVSFHKDFLIIPSQALIPIQVGAELSDIKLPMLGDDSSLENISAQQPRYSDVTSHYYAFKNDTDGDYIGFMHYRRMFFFGNKSLPLLSTNNVLNDMYMLGLDYDSINDCLNGYDIIVPTDVSYSQPVYDVLCRSYTKPLIDLYIKTVEDLFPQYIPALHKFMYGYTGFYYNMFIMKRELFMEYANLKFTVLFELDKRMKAQNIIDPFGRLFGYLSEFFINFFIHYKNETAPLSIKTLSPFMISPSGNGIYNYRLNAFH